jgi:predicted transcriptional regulator
MSKTRVDTFSRRERQIMDILFARGQATAQEVREALADAPTYSAVRGLLRVLEEKGHIRHARLGARYVYAPLQDRSGAGRSALRQALHTFFGGSVERAVATLLLESDGQLSESEWARLSALLDGAKATEQKVGSDD